MFEATITTLNYSVKKAGCSLPECDEVNVGVMSLAGNENEVWNRNRVKLV